MSDTRYLDWPFLDEWHRQLALQLDTWAASNVPHAHGADLDEECRSLVRSLGGAGWLKHAVGGKPYGASDVIDVGVGDDDGRDFEIVLFHDGEDGFDVVAGVDHNAFTRLLVAKNRAVAMQ